MPLVTLADGLLGPALTGAATSFNTEVASAVTAAAPIALPIIALGVGLKVFRRFVRG